MTAQYDPPYNNPPSNTETKADAAALADQARRDLGEVGHELKQQVGSLQEEAKTQLDQVAGKAKSLAAEQKDLLTEQVGGVVDAIDKVASELESSESASAGYVRLVADGARKFSATLKDNDVDAIMAKAQDFGRQQPVAFMGVAALLGFAASRFVLASAKRQQPASTSSTAGYDGGLNG